MPQVFSFPQTSIPTGEFTIPVTSLPASINTLTVSVARCTTATPTIWPDPATTLMVQTQYSYDGAVTWDFPDTWGGVGGIFHDPKTNTDIAMTSSQQVFDKGSPTHVKGKLTVTNGPLVTSGSIVTT